MAGLMTEDPTGSPGPETVRAGPTPLSVLSVIGGLVLVGAAVGYLLLVRSDAGSTVEPDQRLGDETFERGGGGLDTVDLVAAARDIAEPAGLGDPATVELPAMDDAVGQWLDVDGRQMVPFTDSVTPLWSEGEQACGQVVTSLDVIGDPSDIEAAALSAPDPLVADVLSGLYRTVARAILACGVEAGADEFEARRAELAWQWALATRVLDASGGT